MTYTAQSCREEAAINDKFGDPIMNDPDLLRAHADALEENARLRAERDTHVAVTERIKVALRRRGTDTSYVEWASYCRDALDRAERAEAELTAERERADRNQEDAERWRAAELLFEAGYEMEDGSPAIALFLPEHWDPNEAIDAARRK